MQEILCGAPGITRVFPGLISPFLKTRNLFRTRGVVANEPGLYFLGLHFLFALSSAMIHGVGRDARCISKVIDKRLGEQDVALDKLPRQKPVEKAMVNN